MTTRIAAVAAKARLLPRLAAASAEVLLARRRGRDRVGPVLAGLHAPVEVRTDRWGVPHIYAEDAADLFFAQGYVHARERLWQMDFQRRLGLGELSELLGAGALDNDRLVRILGMGRTARTEAEQLGGEAATAVTAYVGGVNAYLRVCRPYPVEYRLLGVRPRPWQPADVMACGKLMALTLSGNWSTEYLRAAVVCAAGVTTAVRYGLVAAADAEIAAEMGQALRSGLTLPQVADLLADGSDLAKGSNAWAVSGARTASGAPLLACDPHMNLQIPATWYENHLVGGDFAVTGASLPGAPGIVIGHNEHIAWGVTNGRVDVQDLYLERLSPDSASYLSDNGWRPVKVVSEDIVVRGQAAPVVEEVRLTRHGPLVTPLVRGGPAAAGAGAGNSADDGAGNVGLALQWVGAEPSAVLPAVLALNRAPDWAGFCAALAGWTCPAQNFVYADTSGDIGYLLAGTVPVRAKGNGKLPSPGWTGDYDWIGTVPAESMPRVRNPAEGYVLSANDGVRGAGDVVIDGEWLADYRAQRIAQLITGQPLHDADSLARLQADLLSLPGLALAAIAHRLPADDECERQARLALERWDGVLSAGSPAGSVYWTLRTELLKAAHQEIAEPLGLRLGLGAYSWQPGLEFLEQYATADVLRLLAGRVDDWLPMGRSWDELLASAWRAALADLRARWGPDVSQWQYGRMHDLVLRHPFGGVPFLGRLLNRGPFPMGGDVDTVCSGHLVAKADGGTSFAGPSYRQICDLADWDDSRSIQPVGQSGRPGDAHYADFVRPWLAGEYHPMLWRRDRVEQETELRATLLPGPGEGGDPNG